MGIRGERRVEGVSRLSRAMDGASEKDTRSGERNPLDLAFARQPTLSFLNASHPQSGFTLIELLIVVAILALVSIIAIPSISNTFRFSVKSAGREIATLIKDAANSAQISGKIHRLAYDLKKDQYWVESTSETTLLQSEESRKIEAERRSIFDDKKDKEADKKGFRQEGLLTKNKKNLPVGVSFKDIYTEQSEEPITEGMAYTHIFPQGMSEKTLIHLIDTSKNEISIVVSNLLARCTIDGRYIEYQEVFKKR
jgi:prepilin-type N-terminal cleavage/methylation domain-containing protein